MEKRRYPIPGGSVYHVAGCAITWTTLVFGWARFGPQLSPEESTLVARTIIRSLDYLRSFAHPVSARDRDAESSISVSSDHIRNGVIDGVGII